MKRQLLLGLCAATTAALMTGCATKQDSSAARARQEATEVAAAEERAMQEEVSAEPAPTVEPAPDAEPAPTIEPAPAPAAEQPAPKPVIHPKPAVYTVTAGDSLSALSVRFGVRQPDILALNPALRANPDRLQIGQQVLLPAGTDVTKAPKPRKAKPAPAAGETVYTVRPGDVLGGIALTHGVSIETIMKANNLKSDTIFVGQKLAIPGAKARGRVVAAKDPASKPAKPAQKAEPKPAPQPKPAEKPAPDAAPEEEPLPEQLGEEALPPPPVAEPADDGEAALPPPPAAEPEAKTQTYVVQEGEDLVGIALKWGVMLQAIREANNLADDVNEVAPGTTLKIPMTTAQ